MHPKPEDVEISPYYGFNLPLSITIRGIPFYPTIYESIPDAIIVYHASQPPEDLVQIGDRDRIFDERSKTMRVRLTPENLRALSKESRKRSPNQNQVMGESAVHHIRPLINSGFVSAPRSVSWQWCHLVAFSMLPTHRAQVKRNLICGTAAVNGQMANIENALTAWILENDTPLSLEVTCNYLINTHFGLRMRYQISNKKTMGLHSEYYDPYSAQYSDIVDLDQLYDRLCANLAST